MVVVMVVVMVVHGHKNGEGGRGGFVHSVFLFVLISPLSWGGRWVVSFSPAACFTDSWFSSSLLQGETYSSMTQTETLSLLVIQLIYKHTHRHA